MTEIEQQGTRRSGRVRRRIDYAALNESHRIQELNKHPHIEEFENFPKQAHPKPIEELVCLVDSRNPKGRVYLNEEGKFDDAQLKQLINDTKLLKPILIRGANPNVAETYDPNINLTMQIPKYDIEKVTEKIGHTRKVPVMDVMTQNNSPRWDMQRWCDYFKTAKENRDKIRNVISLEISDTELGEEVEIPKIVSDLDIILKLFANENDQLGELLESHGVFPPKVRKYILMSVAGSYTDFHIDFAGTSVYYSPLSGHKQFILIPPIHRNLEIYKKWCLSDDQNNVWLPSLFKPLTNKDIFKIKKSDESNRIPEAYLNNGFIVDILPGDLLLLPSMWIHSVYTKEDSIIIGGNYLNLLSLENHLETYKIEVATKVNDQFKFPNFVKFIWLIAYYLMQHNKTQLDEFHIRCYTNLVKFLQEQWNFVNSVAKNDKREKTAVAKIRHAIPNDIIGDTDSFLEKLSKWIKDLLPIKKEESVKEKEESVSKRRKLE